MSVLPSILFFAIQGVWNFVDISRAGKGGQSIAISFQNLTMERHLKMASSSCRAVENDPSFLFHSLSFCAQCTLSPLYGWMAAVLFFCPLFSPQNVLITRILESMFECMCLTMCVCVYTAIGLSTNDWTSVSSRDAETRGEGEFVSSCLFVWLEKLCSLRYHLTFTVHSMHTKGLPTACTHEARLHEFMSGFVVDNVARNGKCSALLPVPAGSPVSSSSDLCLSVASYALGRTFAYEFWRAKKERRQ